MENFLQNFLDNFYPWFLDHGVRIIFIFLGAYLSRRFAGILIDKVVRKAVVSKGYLSPQAEKKREDTLIVVFEGGLKVIIWAAAILMSLAELGINIGPLLAGAGVIGLALGFGAQYIVRDFVSGLFVILENQYRVGDVICVGETCGTVEDLDLRTTVLRDLDGGVHHIPNGEIGKSANLSKDFARVNLDIGVSYLAKLEKVIEVVNQTGKEMAEDPQWKEDIIKAPEFLRVEDFADSAVVIKILGETKPLRQWDVTGELRKRIKIAFDKEGIEIPFPQRVVHQARE